MAAIGAALSCSCLRPGLWLLKPGAQKMSSLGLHTAARCAAKDYYGVLVLGGGCGGTTTSARTKRKAGAENVAVVEPGKKRRRRLDRNMIGEPMNFVHNAHVGTREMSSDFSSTASIQDHMKSKGGYTNGTSATAEL